ncbi:MAG: flagellar hook-associated protein FlgK, partial [Deltaproteobacteria bacterium]|nr:flagellar hook-associated protein FlgK [Deltaproteobacteria bacterium]
MITMSSIMSTALSGLQAYQTAISVTGTNIANVGTDGYSRQVAIIKASCLSKTNGVQIVSGSEVTDVKRVYDQFCNNKIVDAKQGESKYESQLKYLQYAEDLVDESQTDGLSSALSDFWNSWQELANNPSGNTERTNIVSKASTLADKFNQTAKDLKSIQQEIDQEIKTSVGQVNSLTTQIAKVNQQVMQ